MACTGVRTYDFGFTKPNPKPRLISISYAYTTISIVITHILEVEK